MTGGMSSRSYYTKFNIDCPYVRSLSLRLNTYILIPVCINNIRLPWNLPGLLLISCTSPYAPFPVYTGSNMIPVDSLTAKIKSEKPKKKKINETVDIREHSS